MLSICLWSLIVHTFQISCFQSNVPFEQLFMHEKQINKHESKLDANNKTQKCKKLPPLPSLFPCLHSPLFKTQRQREIHLSLSCNCILEQPRFSPFCMEQSTGNTWRRGNEVIREQHGDNWGYIIYLRCSLRSAFHPHGGKEASLNHRAWLYHKRNPVH